MNANKPLHANVNRPYENIKRVYIYVWVDILIVFIDIIYYGRMSTNPMQTSTDCIYAGLDIFIWFVCYTSTLMKYTFII